MYRMTYYYARLEHIVLDEVIEFEKTQTMLYAKRSCKYCVQVDYTIMSRAMRNNYSTIIILSIGLGRKPLQRYWFVNNNL